MSSAGHRGQPCHHRHFDDPDARYRLYHGHPGFVQGDYLSGTIRMIDALLVAACIAIGTGFVLWCYSLLTGVNIA